MQSVIQASCLESDVPGNHIASLTELGGRLGAKGVHQVIVLSELARTLPWSRELIDDGHDVRFLSLKPSRWLSTSRSLAQIAKETNAVLIHTHFSRFQVPTFLAAQRGGLARRLIWHQQSFPAKSPTLWRRFLQEIKNRVLSRTLSTLACSAELGDAFVERGVRKEGITVIDNCASSVHATRSTDCDLRHEFGIAASTKIILMFGWDPERKGVDLILEAMQRVHGDVVLLLVGSKAMHEFVDTVFHGKYPDWLRLGAPRPHVGDYYGVADAYALASRREGLPFAVIESMFNELVVVGSRISGMSWANDVDGVLLFESEDTDALAAQIQMAVDFPREERATLGKSNKAYAEQKFSMKSWVDNVVSYYARIAPDCTAFRS